jgi:ribulose 1,5-bisphosphate synthetase/thiazole synthase
MVSNDEKKKIEKNEIKKKEFLTNISVNEDKNNEKNEIIKEKKYKKADIIIIGAGMAGIAAAKKLLSFNQDYNIIILESSNRIGKINLLIFLKNY